MYEYQTDNITDEIKQKIKLFTKEKYFKLFSYMLTKKAKNFSAFKKISSLVLSIDNLIKEKELKRKKKLNITKSEEKKPRISPWFYFMMHICNVPHKKKYINPRKNELNIDPIIYGYMTNYCHIKIKILTNFSIHKNLNLDTLVKYYLDLCSEQIMIDKENLNNEENQSQSNEEKVIVNNNKDYYNRRKSKSKLKNMKELKNFSSSELKNVLKIKSTKNVPISSPKNNKLKITSLLDKKSKKDGKQIDYRNSFTRLFIGETDQKSVKERYLSNIIIKKVKELHLFNKNVDISSLYLKKLYHKLFKDENGIDNEMNMLVKKFKIDSKMVENYQRSALSFDKQQNNENYIDEDKEKLQNQLQSQIKVYSKPILQSAKFRNYKKVSRFRLDSPMSENENRILMKLRTNRNKLNINIKENRHRSLMSDLSSDYDKKYSSIFSRNSKNINSFRNSMTNNSKTNSTITNSRLSKYKVKINLKYSPVTKLRLNAGKNSINKSNDIFINIKTKLNKANDYTNKNKNHFKGKTYLDDVLFDNKIK